MHWIITYRNKSGSQEQLSLEAESREAVFKELARRGISAIRVEPANGKVKLRKASPESGGKPSGVARGVLAGVIVVAAAVAAWFFLTRGMGRGERGTERGRKPARIAEATPAPAPQPKAETPPPKTAEEELPPHLRRVKDISCTTNQFGQIVERYQTADGKTHKLIRPSRPPLFSHATDDLLSMALAQSGGGAMPPLPLGGDMDAEFLKSLDEPIVIDKNAPPEIQERQRIVQQARIEVKALMDQGLHFRDILADHEKLFNDNAEIRAEAIAEARKIRDEGDTEGTAQFVDAMNAAFQSMGIDPIEMPKSREERMEARRARRAEREARRNQP
ncbi:MAG: hypothetical protein ACI4RD_01295 [Kiritimatiellia bacterium]